MHDIGKLALDQLFPDEFRQVITLAKDKSIYFRKAERQLFGRPHQDIGEYLLDKWKIPDILKDAVKNHHNPMDSTVDPLLVSTVHISDIVAHMLGIGNSGEIMVPDIDEFAERELGLSLSDLEHIVPEIKEQIKESEDLLMLQA